MLANDPIFLPMLRKIIRTYNIDMMIISSGNSKLSHPLSVISDNVIFLWRDYLLVENDKELSANQAQLMFYIDKYRSNSLIENNALCYYPIKEVGNIISCQNGTRQITGRLRFLSDPILPNNEIDNFRYAEEMIKRAIDYQGIYYKKLNIMND